MSLKCIQTHSCRDSLKFLEFCATDILHRTNKEKFVMSMLYCRQVVSCDRIHVEHTVCHTMLASRRVHKPDYIFNILDCRIPHDDKIGLSTVSDKKNKKNKKSKGDDKDDVEDVRVPHTDETGGSIERAEGGSSYHGGASGAKKGRDHRKHKSNKQKHRYDPYNQHDKS